MTILERTLKESDFYSRKELQEFTDFNINQNDKVIFKLAKNNQLFAIWYCSDCKSCHMIKMRVLKHFQWHGQKLNGFIANRSTESLYRKIDSDSEYSSGKHSESYICCSDTGDIKNLKTNLTVVGSVNMGYSQTAGYDCHIWLENSLFVQYNRNHVEDNNVALPFKSWPKKIKDMMKKD
jgi:hypothetical protein